MGRAAPAVPAQVLLVGKMRAHYLFAIAENDDKKDPEAKNVLREAFAAAAGLPAEIEVYAGTLHGWCPPDSAVYHEAQAERAFSRLLALFETALARGVAGAPGMQRPSTRMARAQVAGREILRVRSLRVHAAPGRRVGGRDDVPPVDAGRPRRQAR